MDEASIEWRVVAAKSDVLQAGLRDVQVGRRIVLLVSDGDQVFAFQGTCPHQSARLAHGSLLDGTIQCPHHLAQFRIADGTCTGGWQLPPLRRYAVRVDGDDVLLSEPLLTLD